MDVKRVLAAHVGTHLAQGFHEGQTFNVAHRAAHLYQHHIRLALFSHQPNVAFDLVGDVGNDLNRAAQIIATPFTGNDLSINAPVVTLEAGCKLMSMNRS